MVALTRAECKEIVAYVLSVFGVEHEEIENIVEVLKFSSVLMLRAMPIEVLQEMTAKGVISYRVVAAIQGLQAWMRSSKVIPYVLEDWKRSLTEENINENLRGVPQVKKNEEDQVKGDLRLIQDHVRTDSKMVVNTIESNTINASEDNVLSKLTVPMSTDKLRKISGLKSGVGQAEKQRTQEEAKTHLNSAKRLENKEMPAFNGDIRKGEQKEASSTERAGVITGQVKRSHQASTSTTKNPCESEELSQIGRAHV